MLKYMRPRVNSFSKNTETENWTVKSHSGIVLFLKILPVQWEEGLWKMNFPFSCKV